MEFDINLSDAETEATARCIADADCVVSQLEREICRISLTDQIWFNKELPIRWIKSEVMWYTICSQVLRKTIERCLMHFSYPMLHLASHIWQWIWRMGSVDNFTSDVSKSLHMGNVKRHIDVHRILITFDRGSITITGLPVLTIWKWHSHILLCKADMVLTLQMISTDYLLPIHHKILAELIIYPSRIVRTIHLSAPYHNRYIIWEKLMSTECAEVSK